MSRRSARSNAVAPRLSTPPNPSRTSLIHASTTTSSATVQPAQTAPCVLLPHQLTRPEGRWSWVSRHPIATIFSIIIFIVVILIIVMILTLNGDVQPLYGQIPYNVTGVSAL